MKYQADFSFILLGDFAEKANYHTKVGALRYQT